MTSSVRERTTTALRELSKVAGEAEANHWPKLAAALRATCATAEARLESRDLTVVVAGGGGAKRALLNQLAGDTLFPPAAVEPDGCLVVLRRAARVGYVARLVDGRVEDFARLSPDRSTRLTDAVATATRELAEIDQRLAQMGVELEERKRVESERTRPPTKSAFAFFIGWLEALLRIFRPRPRPQLKSPRVVSVMIARRDVERSIEEAQREREKAEVTLRRAGEEAGTHDAERQRAFVAAIQSLTDAAARGRDVVELTIEVPSTALPADVAIVDAPAAVSPPVAAGTIDAEIRRSHLRELRDRAGACILVAAPGSVSIGDLEDSLHPIIPHVIESLEAISEVLDRARAEAPLSVLALALADLPARLQALVAAAAAGETECRNRIASLERDRLPEPEKFRKEKLEELAGAIDEGAQRVLRHARERLHAHIVKVESGWIAEVDACRDRRAIGECAQRIEAAAPALVAKLLDTLGDDIGAEMQTTSEALQVGVIDEVRRQYRTRYRHVDKPSAVIAELPADETTALATLPLTEVFFGFHRQRAAIWLGAVTVGATIGAVVDAAVGALLGGSTGAILGTIAALLPATETLKRRCHAAIRAYTSELERGVAGGIERSCTTFARDIRSAIDDTISGALAERSRSILRLIELEGTALEREQRRLAEIRQLRDALDARAAELVQLAERSAVELRDYVARTRGRREHEGP